METSPAHHDLVESVRAAARGRDRRRAAATIASLIRSHGSYRWAGVYEVREEEISVLGWSGPDAPAHAVFPRGAGLCGRAVRSCATVCVDDVAADPDYLTTFESTRSEIVVPVPAAGTVPVGLIDVESERVGAFSAGDRAVLEACAAAIAALWRPGTWVPRRE